MILFESSIKQTIYDLLINWGLGEKPASIVDGVVVLIYICLLILVINILFRWGVMRAIRWMVHQTRVKWDDIIFDDKIMKRLSGIVTPIVLKMLMPLALEAVGITSEWMIATLYKCIDIYIVVAILLLVNSLLKAIYSLMVSRPSWQDKPIKGLLETLQVILVIIGIILIIAIIIDKSPVGLLAGLGASAAVISFIFKDSLLGLIAGVQLSANNMLKVGDWIEMPSRGIDGMVTEVTLTTIKIRSWDNTRQTIPPYLLISEPFINWQAMRDSGGRRVKRSLNIDMAGVAMATDDLIAELSANQTLAPIMRQIETTTPEGGTLTNLELYMRVVNRYLDNHPRVNHNMLCMVRQLQPTQWGIPVELYFFTSAVDWVPHEHLQTEIISHVVAFAPLFGLHLYQAPSTLTFRA